MIQRILLIELLGGIGDVIIALPMLHTIARSYPEAHLTVLTFAPGSELLQHDPYVHEVISVPTGQARQAVANLLQQQSFDLIISDTNYDGIATIIQSSAATRVITNLWRSPPPNELVGDRFVKILLDEGIITSTATLPDEPQIYLTTTEQITARQRFGAAYRPLVFLCPDAGMPIKRWSVANWITVGTTLHHQLGATIVVSVGSDPLLSEQLAAAIDGTAQVLPRQSLRQFAAAIAHADLVIAADTGPARIAAAVHVPTITLFGPSWHGRYGQPAPHINLQGYPDCPERVIRNFTEQYCWYSGECPLEWKTCLDDISPDQVLQAATKLLVSPQPAPVLPVTTRTHSPGSPSTSMAGTDGVIEAVSPPTLLPAWQSVRNLLVMRLDNIGDVIMTSPALTALKENLPDANITLMASPSGSLTTPLLLGIDEVLTWRVLWQDLGRLEFDPAREWELIATLKQRQFDAAIILTSFAQSPHPAALICALAGIPLRLGESKEQDFGTLTHPMPPLADHIHQVERNLQLIESVGFQVRDRRLTLPIPDLPLPVQKPYILLNPWTSCQSRNYDTERFAIAAFQLNEITGWPIVVTGVAKDRDRAQPLLDILGNGAIDLIGQTNLSELVALVAGAKLVLTNNTSTMHIADATNTPSVILFAGTEQECQWQPHHSPSRLLRRPTVCSPCYAFTCPYKLQCLDIAPETVVVTALELLNKC